MKQLLNRLIFRERQHVISGEKLDKAEKSIIPGENYQK